MYTPITIKFVIHLSSRLNLNFVLGQSIHWGHEYMIVIVGHVGIHVVDWVTMVSIGMQGD